MVCLLAGLIGKATSQLDNVWDFFYICSTKNHSIMKKLIIFLLLCLVSISTFAQQYELTPEGLVSSDGKDYIYVDVPNTPAADLYKLLEKELIPIFPPSKTTYNKETEDRIAITTAAMDLFRVSAGPMMQYIMDIEYTIIIDIKDDKFRMRTPTINLIGTLANFRVSRMVIYDDPKNHKDFKKNQFIFNYKDRSVQNEKAKLAIESHINKVVSQIVKINSVNEDW